MGNHITNDDDDSNINRSNSKLAAEIPITSPLQQQYMQDMIQKRPQILKTQYICTAKAYDFVQENQGSKLSCMHSKKLIVYYDYFDYCLDGIVTLSYSYSTPDICYFIYCITEALFELRDNKIHHGDISIKNIVKRGTRWQLVDKIFIKNGINAYEKVLQGEQGFISPSQMEKIRLGFVRQSPQISEADDIFSLGMVTLQLASRKPSRKCYRQSFIRFNDSIIEQNFNLAARYHQPELVDLIRSMLQFVQNDRISLNQLRSHPLIINANKLSLKQKTQNSTQNLSNSNIRRTNKPQSYIKNSQIPQKSNPQYSQITFNKTNFTSYPAPASKLYGSRIISSNVNRYNNNNTIINNSNITNRQKYTGNSKANINQKYPPKTNYRQ